MFKAARVSTSNFRKFLDGLSAEVMTANGFLKSYQDEYDIRTTTLFIDEWESALGIPDDCFTGTSSIEDRRRDALAKLASLGVQTPEDFVDLAAIFGVSVTIKSGIDVGGFPVTFPFILGDAKTLRNTIIVEYSVVTGQLFPFTFPLTFGDPAIDLIRCLFGKLKPATAILQFDEV